MTAWRLDHLPPQLRQAFQAYYRRIRFLRAVRLLLATVIAYAPLAWVAMHVERFANLTDAQRLALSASVHAGIGLAAMLWLAVVVLRRVPVKKVAYSLEAKLDAAAQERYTTLTDMLNRRRDTLRPDELRLVDELETGTLATGFPQHPARLVRDRTLAPITGLCGAVVALFLMPFLWENYQYGLMLQRFLQPHRALPRPTFVQLDVTASAEIIGQGRPFALNVSTRGHVPPFWRWFLELGGQSLPATPRLRLESPGEPDSATERELTRIRDGHYIYTESRVERGFRFQVRHGDATSPPRIVEAVPVPNVTQVVLDVVPPAYTGLPAQRIEHTGQAILLLKESRIRLTFGVSQPVRRREILSDLTELPIEPEWDDASLAGTHAFVLRDPLTLTIALENERGFRNSHSPMIAFKLLEDQPASVRIQTHEVVAECAATDVVSIPFIAEDDYGIAEIALNVVINPLPDSKDGGTEQTPPARHEAKNVQDIAQLDLSRFDVNPGDRVQIRVRVRDSAGQSSFSQVAMLAISAFGRGTREEARVRALRFLATALERIGESTTRGDGGTGGVAGNISDGIYNRILADAERLGVPLAKPSRFSSILEAVEREHFLTECPWDKDDLRQIHGVLALASAALAGGRDPVERRNDILFELNDRILTPITDYRELRNLMWRLFGLRDAALNTQALERARNRLARVELIFDTLDTCMGRLLIIARRNRNLDRDKLNAVILTVADIRSRLTGRAPEQTHSDEPFGLDRTPREPSPRTVGLEQLQPAMRELGPRLDALLALAQAALPKALEAHTAAAQELRTRHAAMVRHMVELATAAATEPTDVWSTAMDVLETDMRLLRTNPLFMAGAFILGHRLSAHLLEARERLPAGAPPPSDLGQILGAADDGVFAEHARALGQFHAYAQVVALDRLPAISEAERGFAARLAVVEALARWPDAEPSLPARHAELRGLNLARGERDASPILDRRHTIGMLAGAYPGLEARLRAALRRAEHAASLDDEAKTLAAAFAATNSLLGAPAKATAALDYERHRLRQFVDRLLLRMTAIPPDSDAGLEGFASFFLAMREFRDRPVATLLLLNDAPGAGRITRAHLADIDLSAALLGQHRAVVVSRLHDILNRWRHGEPQELKEYQRVLLGKMHETQLALDTALHLAGESDGSARVRHFIAASAEATASYLAATMPSFLDIIGQLEGARERIVSQRAFAKDAKETLVRAARGLDAIAEQVAWIQESGFRAYLVGELHKAAETFGTLARNDSDVHALVHQSGTLIERLRDLAREVAALTLNIDELRYAGGALELKDISAVRMHEAERHLAEVFAFERESMIARMFESLQEKPPAESQRLALAHAAFVYRVVRSDIVRYRPAIPITPGGGEKGDYVEFLNEELAKATKIAVQHYQRVVRAHLGRMGGFPWEIPKE